MRKINYQIPVLMYHRVVRNRDEAGKHNIYVTLKNLEKQFEYLKNHAYQTITFKDIYRNKKVNSFKQIILTFDDGYVDNYTLLFPLLKKYEFTAVIFLVTKLSKNEWGILEGEPCVDLMNELQLKEMSHYGIEFGGHTQNHVNLNTQNDIQLINEIKGCKEDIEEILNSNIISFSYPFGATNERIKQIVKDSGYIYGISTNTGPNNLHDDLLQIKRIEVSCRTSLSRFKAKVRGNYYKPALIKELLNNLLKRNN